MFSFVVFIRSRPGFLFCPSLSMVLLRGCMLMGRVNDFLKFVLYSVNCYQILTLWDLARAAQDIIFWAVAFEPKTVCIIAGDMPPLSSLFHITVNFIHSHTELYGIGLVKGRRWRGFPRKHASQQVDVWPDKV